MANNFVQDGFEKFEPARGIMLLHGSGWLDPVQIMIVVAVAESRCRG